MEFLQKKLTLMFESWRTAGALHVVYALLLEALFIGYVYFVGLFTVETLLPTFVTARFSLTLFFSGLVLLTFLLALLGRFLGLSFAWNITKKHPLLWLGILWGIGILSVSMIKFLFFIPILIVLFGLSGYLFWQILFEQK